MSTLSAADGRFVAEAALDAVAAATERIAEDRVRLVGIQITLVVETRKGVRMVGVTKERRRASA